MLGESIVQREELCCDMFDYRVTSAAFRIER